MVPGGANNGAILPASKPPRTAPICTSTAHVDNNNGGPKIAVTPNTIRTFRTERDQSASHCIDQTDGRKEESPRGLEPLTFGPQGRRSIHLSHTQELTTFLVAFGVAKTSTRCSASPHSPYFQYVLAVCNRSCAASCAGGVKKTATRIKLFENLVLKVASWPNLDRGQG